MMADHEVEELIKSALYYQWEREKNKVVKPNQWHPETFMEYHESRDELQECCDDYGREIV